MLTELSVENFALVEKLRLSFGPGLNLLTGETGAGKSILLDALGMALGERTGPESIRHGADKARVEVVFTIDDTDIRLKAAMETAGLEAEDSLLIVSRELSATGKSSVRINGRPATVGTLKAVGDALVDIHGQHQHQSLLDAQRHAEILDAWCGPEITVLKTAVAKAAGEAAAAARELSTLRQDARERARTIDLLSFQQGEIDAANPLAAEEDALLAEQMRLASAEKLHAAALSAYAALHGGAATSATSGRGGRGSVGTGIAETGGALEGLTTAAAEIEHAARLDERLAPLLEALNNALFVAEDAAREVRTYRDGIEFNPERLEEIETRLDTLKTLKKKYGDTLDEVLRYREEIAVRLETLENAETRIVELQEIAGKTAEKLSAQAAKLTRARQKAAKPFSDAILKELADLAMTATRFSVAIEPRPPTAQGADQVEFLISPNPGEPLKPLAKIASGGEISRIMLAMKSVLSRTYSVPTLIFDEIDAGIGGRTGTVLADKLAALSGAGQILCITHLPQIAAKGDRHFFIEKHTEKGRTRVSVAPLTGEGRVQELARMLGGARLTDTVLQHAREMLGHTAETIAGEPKAIAA
ncbi:MAG: DNA repair protein RecN [Cytophagales bacterium]|nr:DNA repair protein RecN [Armatimonadota bacterium]